MEPTRSDRNPARILFLSRRYPPSLGGIQTHCFHLYTRLKEYCPVTLIALGMDSLLHLLWFLPYAWLRAFLALVLRRVDAVYFSDGVICCLAPLLRPFASSSCRFVVTIFGLEMTYGNRAAQALMRAGARVCERITVISENSRRLAVEWGLPADRIELIYVGVEPALPAQETCEALRLQFETDYGLRFGSDRVLLKAGATQGHARLHRERIGAPRPRHSSGDRWIRSGCPTVATGHCGTRCRLPGFAAGMGFR